jgi:hypothetical protein
MSKIWALEHLTTCLFVWRQTIQWTLCHVHISVLEQIVIVLLVHGLLAGRLLVDGRLLIRLASVEGIVMA